MGEGIWGEARRSVDQVDWGDHGLAATMRPPQADKTPWLWTGSSVLVEARSIPEPGFFAFVAALVR